MAATRMANLKFTSFYDNLSFYLQLHLFNIVSINVMMWAVQCRSFYSSSRITNPSPHIKSLWSRNQNSERLELDIGWLGANLELTLPWMFVNNLSLELTLVLFECRLHVTVACDMRDNSLILHAVKFMAHTSCAVWNKMSLELTLT